MTLLPKQSPLRDRPYLDWLRKQPCILTGTHPSECVAVDPAHIGTAGRGMKSPDNEALPILHSIHRQMHSEGEMSVLLAHMSPELLRLMARAYARDLHAGWVAAGRPK